MDYISNPDYREEHDRVLDAYANYYLQKQYPQLDFTERNYSCIQSNPALKRIKPDIVGRDDDNEEHVRAEIETPGLITMGHAKGHWDIYADFDGDFHLIVNVLYLEQAQKILDQLAIGDLTILRGYAWIGTRLLIYDAEDLL